MYQAPYSRSPYYNLNSHATLEPLVIRRHKVLGQFPQVYTYDLPESCICTSSPRDSGQSGSGAKPVDAPPLGMKKTDYMSTPYGWCETQNEDNPYGCECGRHSLVENQTKWPLKKSGCGCGTCAEI